LGPDEENKFHELKCIGIENVTSEFRKYDLLDIIDEYKRSASQEEGNLPLPKYVGGGEGELVNRYQEHELSSGSDKNFKIRGRGV